MTYFVILALSLLSCHALTIGASDSRHQVRGHSLHPLAPLLAESLEHARIRRFITLVPKAELHVHLEGTLEPEMMLRLASRNGLPLPYPDSNAAHAAYDFKDLQSFLDLYYRGTRVLVTTADFYDLAMAYFKRAKEEHVSHIELFFDPQSHLSRNVTFSTFFWGIHSAALEARAIMGLDVHLIMCFLRHLDEDSAFEALRAATPYKDHLLGVGLDSSESGRPPSLFKRVFREARRMGLKVVAHAGEPEGEEGPAEYIWEAIEELHVDRVDHGIHSLDDPDLIAYLEKTRIGLTVCPLSNLRLKVFPDEDAAARVLGQMFLGTKMIATVNSDDPAYFGGYLVDNYLKVQWVLELTLRQVALLVINSWRASFITGEARGKAIRSVEDMVKEAERW